MTLKGLRLVEEWESVKGDISRREFAESIGRTEAAVRSEIYRARQKYNLSDDGANILIFDIETSPILCHVWRLGEQRIYPHQIKHDWFIISWAAKWLGKDAFGKVLTPKEIKKRDDKRIVADLWELFNQADIIIAHNCNRFDKKKANWRFAYHKFGPPLPYKVIDTLTEVRKYFGATSKTLDFLLEKLGIRTKLDTDFSLWTQCMNGNKSALNSMLEYNLNDVDILEQLYKEIRPWIFNHPNLTLYDPDEDVRCPICKSDNITIHSKLFTTSANAYTTYRCNDCNHVGRTKSTTTGKDKRKNLLK